MMECLFAEYAQHVIEKRTNSIDLIEIFIVDSTSFKVQRR